MDIASFLVYFAVMAAGNPSAGGEAAAAAEAGNAFAIDLYGRLSAAKGNLFLSPHSIHVAVAMAAAGARGETAADMANVLHLPAERPEAAFRALIVAIDSGSKMGQDELYRLSVANSMWGQKGYPFRQEYLDLVKADFGGEMSAVDFMKAADAARLTINAWVEERTARKIKDLLQPGVLTPDTRLVLANAIYMKSAWLETFKKEMTKEAPFHLAGGKTAKVPLMRRIGGYGYLEGDGLQAVEIPYAGDRLSMVILLPAKADGLSALEKKLSGKALTGWLAGLKHRQVDLAIPRFRVTSSFSVADALKALGMERAFVFGKADFSGIAPGNELFIGDVIHKAYVDVNEEGTEAAAATAVVMRAGGAPAREKPVVFKADRPFLFLIRHHETGAILFLGRLADPGHQD